MFDSKYLCYESKYSSPMAITLNYVTFVIMNDYDYVFQKYISYTSLTFFNNIKL